MKIVKRDGRTVDYNPEKIKVAIGKANNEVSASERIGNKEIDHIIEYIESLDKRRMLVEDIQDIIEEKLMESGKFSLAKKYIIYRYKRSIIRQSNTTDASILSLLKGSNNVGGAYLVANRQRDVMAGEASKDLAYRLLLPQNVVAAEKDNRLKFCNVEYFTEPVIEGVKINLLDMFESGTVINGVRVEEPKSFQSACNVLVEIIASVAACQTGNIYIELKDLFKYYHMSYEKEYGMYKSLMKTALTNEQIRAITETQAFIEVKSGIQTIFYQTNTITLPNGLVPRVHFLIDTSDIASEVEERLVFEFVRQKSEGIKNADGEFQATCYPMIVYSLNEDEPHNPYDYITKELLSSNSSYYLMSKKRFESFRKEIDKVNQGSMILNLAHLALDAKEDETVNFLTLLDETLGYCYEGLLCRNHNLQGVYSDKSPIHWRYGAVARLASMERIDAYLKKDYSYMTLVVLGFEDALKILGDADLKKSTRDKIVDTIKNWNKENTFNVVLSNYFDIKAIDEIYRKDEDKLKRYGITELCDSAEFMKTDYFKDGFMYVSTTKDEDLTDKELLNKNFIIKKELQNKNLDD